MKRNAWNKMAVAGPPPCRLASCVVFLPHSPYCYKFAIYDNGKWKVNVDDTDFMFKDYVEADSEEIEAYYPLFTTNGYYDAVTLQYVEPEDKSQEWECDWAELDSKKKPLTDVVVITYMDGTHNPYRFGAFYDYPGAEMDWPFIEFTYGDPFVQDIWPDKYIAFTPYKPIGENDWPVSFWDKYKLLYVMEDINHSIAEYIADGFGGGTVDEFIKLRPRFASRRAWLEKEVAKEEERRNNWT